MKQRFLIGNWKCYKSSTDAVSWFDAFAAHYTPIDGLSVIVAPPVILLESLASYINKMNLKNVFLAAQDISPFPKGAYTGAVAADMVRGLVDYVIIGHSERRRYFHETTQDILNKVNETEDADLIPILCVDQPEELKSFKTLQDCDCAEMIVAYAPVDALNFRIPASLKEVGEAAEQIVKIGPARSVVYGGAVDKDNTRQYLDVSDISGLFVGSASLDAKVFVDICREFDYR
jgi:triosephosphate isomerase (TIM)